jgi:hypothetical protein
MNRFQSLLFTNGSTCAAYASGVFVHRDSDAAQVLDELTKVGGCTG